MAAGESSAVESVTYRTITLQEAVRTALEANLSIRVSRTEVLQAGADVIQSKLIANPELVAETENFSGTGMFQNRDSMEQSLVLSQEIELGGKRKNRIVKARVAETLKKLDLELDELSLCRDVALAFFDLLGWQERVKVLQDRSAIANEMAQTIKVRVEAGKVPHLESLRASVLAESARLRLLEARNQMNVADLALQTLLGKGEEQLLRATYRPIGRKDLSMDAGDWDSNAEDHPFVLRYLIIHDLREAERKVARSLQYPDIVLSGGVRWFEESGDRAYLAGLSIGLPILHRNQGEIARADLELDRARLEVRARVLEIEKERSRIRIGLDSSSEAMNAYQTSILTQAEEAFQYARESYIAGKIGYVALLDAMNNLFEIREAYVNVFIEYYNQRARAAFITADRDWFISEVEP